MAFTPHQDLSKRDGNECAATFEGVCLPAVIVLLSPTDGGVVDVAYVRVRMQTTSRLHRTMGGEVERKREFLWGSSVFFGPCVVKWT